MPEIPLRRKFISDPHPPHTLAQPQWKVAPAENTPMEGLSRRKSFPTKKNSADNSILAEDFPRTIPQNIFIYKIESTKKK